MSVPDNVREQLKAMLWKLADEIDWMSLSPTTKSRHYESWTRDPAIGGILARYVRLGEVRVYLKDTLLKEYAQHRLEDASVAYRVLGIPAEISCEKRYIKPHGLRLQDGRIICWGRATTWKAILMATFERALERSDSTPFAVVLSRAVGRFSQSATRIMIEEAARRLGISHVVWLET